MQMTISIVVIQVTISVAMYVTVSSSKFIFLSLTNTNFHKIDQNASVAIRHHIKFAFHHFSKYASNINIPGG